MLDTLAQHVPMQFGFCYISDYYEHVHGAYSAWYHRLLHEWQTADRLGYDTLWIAEHRLAGYGFCSTPVVAQAIADRTERIRIGTAVSLLSQRHPVLTAEDWAAVDLLSGGRLNFGIGRGILAYDFAAVGVDSAESRERFQEAWDIIRRLWSEDCVSHKGKFWSFEEHSLRPQPEQKPTPPIFVACIATPDSYRWAGRNGCHLMVAPFLLKTTSQQCEYLDLYRESLCEAGHDPQLFQVLGNYHLALVDNENQSSEVDQYIYQYLEFLKRINSDPKRHLDKQQYAAYESGETLWQDAKELRNNRAIVGTAQQCIDRIGELSEACGLTGWMFHVNYGGVPHERVIDQMHLFTGEVMPAFKAIESPTKTIESADPKLFNGATHVAGKARRITEIATSFARSCVLFAANKLDLFTFIGNESLTAREVSARLQCSVRGVERLLDACVSLGLLVKTDDHFRVSDDGRVMLDRNSPNYLGDWVAHWADMMVRGNWQKLAENVRAGRALPLDNQSPSFDPQRDSLENWVVGMHEMAIAGHAEILSMVDSLREARSFLDVGGGPGTYSVQMCRRHPQLSAVILDAPDVSQVAARFVSEARLSHRIRFIHGDFRHDRINETFDAILLSNVLHMCDEAGAMQMLHNAVRHLNTGGTLLVQEWMLSDDGTAPPLSALFNLHMLINPDGDLFRTDQLRSMIEGAGLTLNHTIDTGGAYDVIVASKDDESRPLAQHSRGSSHVVKQR